MRSKIITFTAQSLGTLENVLGKKNLERIMEFTKTEAGWDFGKGEPFNPKSLKRLDRFLAHYQIFPPNEPSVFMMASGNLQLEWTEEGKHFEIEFSTDKFEYCFETVGEGECTTSREIIETLWKAKKNVEQENLPVLSG